MSGGADSRHQLLFCGSNISIRTSTTMQCICVINRQSFRTPKSAAAAVTAYACDTENPPHGLPAAAARREKADSVTTL